MPKLSIITVNLNNAKGLEKTIQSIINQNFTDYEYIIVDGGSTDGSVDIIKKYEDKIDYWVSEKDKGIYNAMNKGIKVAKGEYCLFLNSGDWLFDKNTLSKIFSQKIEADIIYGSVQTLKGIWEYPEYLTFYFFFNNMICHQASIIKRSLFNEIGLYNEDLKIVSDWEFFCKSIIRNKIFLKIDIVVSFYDTIGYSADEKNFTLIKIEKKQVLMNLIPAMYNDYIEMNNLKKELQSYKNSRIIQFVRKIQKSKFYNKIYYQLNKVMNFKNEK